jgi:hypothetical protein
MKLNLIIILILTICNVSTAQTKYEIKSYELVERKSDYVVNDELKTTKFLRYEFQKLFIKEKAEWLIDTNFQSRHSTNVILGKKLNPVLLTLKYDSTDFYLPNRDKYYRGNIKIKLPDYYLTNFNVDWPFLKRLTFCTNNSKYKQTIALKKYIVEKPDLQIIRNNLFNYIKDLYVNYCLPNRQDFSDSILKYYLDSVLVVNPNNPIIKIDSNETYITEKGERIIKFKFVSIMWLHGIYPFNESCFREDNGYENPTLTIFIDNNNRFRFLSDELTLLNHGDFDNDGNDEFIFWSSIFNHDKFILYYDNFQKKCEYGWSYH